MTILSPQKIFLVLGVASAASWTALAFQNGASSQQQQPPTPKPVKNQKTITKSQPPMATKWPIVGTLPDFINRGGIDAMVNVHESMYKDYGPIYGLSILGDDELVVSDPFAFEQVLRKEGKFPIGGSELVSTFVEYYQENELELAQASVGRGPEWKEWRKTMNPDLYVLWDTYLPTMAKTCAEISETAGKSTTPALASDQQETLLFSDFLSRAAFDMISSILYGESPGTTNTAEAVPGDVEFVKATRNAFEITGKLISNPLEKVFQSDRYKEFVVNMDKTFKFGSNRCNESVERAVEMRKRSLQKDTEGGAATPTADSDSSSSNGCPVSAIQASLSGTKKKGLQRNKVVPTEFLNPSYVERLVDRGELNADEISQVAAPLLMAGVDTTAYVMSWFYLNMASNPEVQTKLASQLDEILGGADVTTVEQMDSLEYLNACIRESHRLTPSAAITVKMIETDIDVVVGDKSYLLPKGQRISLNLRGLPMDPEYVEDPKVFRPERFSKDAVETRKGTKAAIALDHVCFAEPFGRGKRRCLGANVARAEMTILAARLLQDWEIRLVDPNEAVGSPTKSWEPKQKLMLQADPFPDMELVPRKKGGVGQHE